jgi:hypothetical protein
MDSEEGSKDQDIKWIRPEEYYDGFQKGRQEEAERWRSIVKNLTALILDQHSPKAKEAEAGEPGGTHPETVIWADPECPVPAQAGERSDFWRNLSRFYDQESIRRATAAEVKVCRQEADAALGAKMRELLVDTVFAPPELVDLIQWATIRSPNHLACLALAWLRKQAGLPVTRPALPERIGWALDTIEGRSEVRLMMPLGADHEAVYAEAVRRYNLYGKIEEWLKRNQREAHNRDSMIEAVGQLSDLLTEGQP